MITCLGCLGTILSGFSAFVLPPRFLANRASGYGGAGAGIGASFSGWLGSSSLLAVFLDCLVSGCFNLPVLKSEQENWELLFWLLQRADSLPEQVQPHFHSYRRYEH